MTIHTDIFSPDRRQRVEIARVERQAARQLALRLNLRRIAKAATEWEREVGRSDEDYWQLRFVEACTAVLESDLSDELDELCREVGCDAEGYPLDACGEPDHSAEKVFVPVSLNAGERGL